MYRAMRPRRDQVPGPAVRPDAQPRQDHSAATTDRAALGGSARPRVAPHLIDLRPVDRRLAHRNLRTGLIAGAVALIMFALSFLVGLVY